MTTSEKVFQILSIDRSTDTHRTKKAYIILTLFKSTVINIEIT